MLNVIPLTKIDEERRLVFARAAEEVPDKSREIMDYASAKPQFEKWSQNQHQLSNGLSKGNLRAMHNPKISAGKINEIMYDDVGHAVDVVCKVVDDNEWRKCLEGVYTGLSIGGGYLRKWKDEKTGLTRYTPIISEISLVDNPCIPTARIVELHKADGSVQELHLSGHARSFAECLAAVPRSFAECLAKGYEEQQHPRGPGGRWQVGPHHAEPSSQRPARPGMSRMTIDHDTPNRSWAGNAGARVGRRVGAGYGYAKGAVDFVRGSGKAFGRLSEAVQRNPKATDHIARTGAAGYQAEARRHMGRLVDRASASGERLGERIGHHGGRAGMALAAVGALGGAAYLAHRGSRAEKVVAGGDLAKAVAERHGPISFGECLAKSRTGSVRDMAGKLVGDFVDATVNHGGRQRRAMFRVTAAPGASGQMRVQYDKPHNYDPKIHQSAIGHGETFEIHESAVSRHWRNHSSFARGGRKPYGGV